MTETQNLSNQIQELYVHSLDDLNEMVKGLNDKKKEYENYILFANQYLDQLQKIRNKPKINEMVIPTHDSQSPTDDISIDQWFDLFNQIEQITLSNNHIPTYHKQKKDPRNNETKKKKILTGKKKKGKKSSSD